VLGGQLAPKGSHPWMASVRIPAGFPAGFHRCGGVVVSPVKVVSAAHCFPPSARTVSSVITGTRFPDDVGEFADADGEQTPIARIVLHPEWSGFAPDGRPISFANDIAVITLKRDTPARALAVATSADDGPAQAGSPLVLSGWGGDTPFNSTDFSEPAFGLMRGTVQAWTDAQCAAYGQDPARTLCAVGASGSPRACFGDSGGPLQNLAARPPKLVGVVSSGYSPCGGDPSYPDFYVRVSAYRAWLAGQVPPAPRIQKVRCAARRCTFFLHLSGIADRVRRIDVRAQGRKARARRKGGPASSVWRARVRRLSPGKTKVTVVPRTRRGKALSKPYRRTIRIKR